MIKFGVKFWDDGVVNLVIGDHEMPFRKMPKWLGWVMARLEEWCFRAYTRDYVLCYNYYREGDIRHDLSPVPDDVMKFVDEAIADIKRRALREQ